MTTPKFVANLNTAKGIRDGVRWIRATGSKFDEIVHKVAVAVIVHANEHGDCSHALSLVLAMPKSARRAALIRWFTAFSPISVTLGSDGKNRVGLRKPDMKNYNPFNSQGAAENPYYSWDKTEDNALAALLGLGDFNEQVIKLAARMKKAVDNNKVKPEEVEAVLAKRAALLNAA